MLENDERSDETQTKAGQWIHKSAKSISWDF
jgi:hypothetical protein